MSASAEPTGLSQAVWRKTGYVSESQEEWLARISAEQNRLRLLWLANAVLACDYGDNQIGQMGWCIRADMLGGEPFMFGPSINSAIDNAIAMEARQGPDPKGLDGAAAKARAEGIAQ